MSNVGIVVDTHTIVWYLSGDQRLSKAALKVLDQATAQGEPIYVPSLCLVELTYLIEKGRLPDAAMHRLLAAIDDPESPCRLVPLDRLITDAISRIKRSDVPDLPDRIIAATALALSAPLVTRDEDIRTSEIQTIW